MEWNVQVENYFIIVPTLTIKLNSITLRVVYGPIREWTYYVYDLYEEGTSGSITLTNSKR